MLVTALWKPKKGKQSFYDSPAVTKSRRSCSAGNVRDWTLIKCLPLLGWVHHLSLSWSIGTPPPKSPKMLVSPRNLLCILLLTPDQPLFLVSCMSFAASTCMSLSPLRNVIYQQCFSAGSLSSAFLLIGSTFLACAPSAGRWCIQASCWYGVLADLACRSSTWPIDTFSYSPWLECMLHILPTPSVDFQSLSLLALDVKLQV